MYECTQMQRKYETKIRRSKDLYVAAEKAGNTELMTETKAKIFQLSNEYRAFSKACGLSPKLNKLLVNGYEN